jgi:hypothetical protein
LHVVVLSILIQFVMPPVEPSDLSAWRGKSLQHGVLFTPSDQDGQQSLMWTGDTKSFGTCCLLLEVARVEGTREDPSGSQPEIVSQHSTSVPLAVLILKRNTKKIVPD